MKPLKLLFTLIGLPVLCGAMFIVLFVTLVGLSVPQLPSWAQGPLIEWMDDIPQETFDTSGAPPGVPYSGGQIPKDGYVGPTSFACILPPEFGELSDYYGVLRPGGYIHSGIDYSTYYRPAPVRTPFGGRVVFAGWSTVGYGNLLVIENSGTQVYLAHNSEFYVHPGQVVNAGDVMALGGTTGNSSGYHVHFEIRVWNEAEGRWIPVDPNLTYLPGQADWCDWNSLSAPPPE